MAFQSSENKITKTDVSCRIAGRKLVPTESPVPYIPIQVCTKILQNAPILELGRYRFFKSVSVFVFFGRFFQKSVSVSVSVFQNIAISVSVFVFFRTNLPLLIE